MRAPAVWAAAVFVLAACSATEQGASTPLPAEQESDALPTPNPIPALTKAKAKKSLLRLSDMPTGWAKERVAREDGGDKLTYSPARCENIEGIPAEATVDLAAVSFSESGALGSSLSQQTYRVKSRPASYRLVLASKSLKKCRTYKIRWSEGTETHHLSPISFPDLGDGTVAVRDSTDLASGGYVVTDSIFVAVPLSVRVS